jgi:hypothetical protein
MTGKTFILLTVLFIATSFKTAQTDLDKISSLTEATNFTISIERFDLGYSQNLQYYFFKNNGEVINVTHKSLIFNFQDSTLNNTALNITVLDSLKSFLTDIKSKEIKSPKDFRKKFNKTPDFDLIQIYNDKDTVKIYDLDNKGLTKIHLTIKDNIK